MALISVSNLSRYKDTIPYLGDDNRPTYGQTVLPREFSDAVAADSNSINHVVSSEEIGFPDMLAVRYYGPGYERLWWVIMQANNIIDPSAEMYPGQRLLIPPRASVLRFIARAGDAVT